jgi:predicted ATPase
VKMNARRTCPVCGILFSGGLKFCPVCLLGMGMGEGVESGEIGPESARVGSALEVARQRFEQYEVVSGEKGTPLELGRGTMGVTYKAFDVDLRYPVALKVIAERYLGDESIRLRFLREARAAASLRHPNVASVFHLGRSGASYFYAMEFVEGETLEHLIKRSGRLEVKLALEIVTQVAAGLAAVHKNNLVHRDIKPANIMVRFEEGGGVMAKIIDLGLAKSVGQSGDQSTISIAGTFAGTPEFASPEQFGGIQVDVRSDLYSLGVTLWEALTGEKPFQGTPAEVMYQHQHACLPLEALERIPQPIAVLIEVLLEKDPGRRFQDPAELLQALQRVTGALDSERRITRRRLLKTPSGASPSPARRPAPRKISIARLPVTGSDIFGREDDIAFLDGAWANQEVNVVTIVAWAGVGKSTLVNHWLRRMASDRYRCAELVFAWSFYRQGSSGETSPADEFFDAALSWFGDPDPRLGTAWEKGERLAKLVASRRTLLLLDGLEPLQNPPGPREGRLREASLQALLRELAGFNTGLCVITTRTPVADLADHERTSALRRDLEQLPSDAGAKLLRSLGVHGSEADLRGASNELSGHSLALTLLGSYLTDAYDGDVRCRSELSRHLAHDSRQGVHARGVMESYQNWLGEGPELSVLRMLGLFDRPADEKAIEALLKSPAIPGLTETLTNLDRSAWRTILARLRRARLLAGRDPHNPGQLDTHPLVREYFGEQLRIQRGQTWKECNKRLFHYYRTLAPQLPNSLREMEPLFSSVICGCNAGLFREAFHEVYLPRIQRENDHFASNVLGATAPLLLVLIHFFEDGRWGSFGQTEVEGQGLTAEDQLFILMQAGKYLTATRGLGASEARICYERAEPLCRSLGLPLLLYVPLIGQWRYYLQTDKMSRAMEVAERLYVLAQRQNDAGLLLGACRPLSCTYHYLGDFEASRLYAMRGLGVWRSGSVQPYAEDLHSPVISCLCHGALSDWYLGEMASCRANLDEALSLAKKLNDMNGLAFALAWAVAFSQLERNPVEVDRLASDLIELSTRRHFGYWQAIGVIWRGWARSAAGDTVEGIPLIEEGISDARATGSLLALPQFLALKAEALHLANRTSEALAAINEAQALAERHEQHWYLSELHRLRGVFLANLGRENPQIEASFCAAITIAREQKAISLEKRVEGTLEEYHRQTASGSGGRGCQVPLW